MPTLPPIKKRVFRLPAVEISRSGTESTFINDPDPYITRENSNNYITRESGNTYVARNTSTGYFITLPPIRKRSFRLPVRLNG